MNTKQTYWQRLVTTDLTIKQLLQEANLAFSALDTPQLDAEILLSDLLDKPRSYLRAWPDRYVSESAAKRYRVLIKKRLSGLSVAHLLGKKDFWNDEFFVNEHVLIPRSETELLVEMAIEKLGTGFSGNILDLGTGSGIIGLCLAKTYPTATVIATDFSVEALKVANKNAEMLAIENVQFLQGYWCEALESCHIRKFDLIVSNPPYIDSNDPHLKELLKAEPKAALIADDNGRQDLNHIISKSINYLAETGWLMVEHGYDQKVAVQDMFEQSHFRQIETRKDLLQQDRATQGQISH